MIKRLLAVLHARNLEFIRDRSSLGWNIILPVLLVGGLAVVFSGSSRPLFRVGVLNATPDVIVAHPLLSADYVDPVEYDDIDLAMRKVTRHQLDMLIDLEPPGRYWINRDAPKGDILEQLLGDDTGLTRASVTGDAIRYIDWLLPGILGMNMMFSCLFGVGFVVVRYRKTGFLKRLRATPLRAFEFITAQVISRLILIMAVMVGVYAGTAWLIGFRMEGSHLLLFLTAAVGSMSMIALGLVVAARVHSEELASGLLNMLSWPMMVLSGVFFPIDGAPRVVRWAAEALPLTQMLDAGRAIMLDGAGLPEIATNLIVLTVMTIVFLVIGAALFRWAPD